MEETGVVIWVSREGDLELHTCPDISLGIDPEGVEAGFEDGVLRIGPPQRWVRGV